jgi:hypothetical protein
MKRIFGIAALALSALLLMALAAFAAVNPANAPNGTHFAGGTSAPTCSVTATTVTCPASSFQLAGVGNTNATETLTATWSATIDCRNHGGQVVESHSQSASVASPPRTLTSDKNGRLTVTPVTVAAPSNADFLAQATCPNPNWTAEVRGGNPTLVSYSYALRFAGFNGAYITLP